MTPKVQVRITAHRINTAQLAKDAQVRDQARRFAEAFGEALAENVGVHVSQLIGSGRWWVSRNKRFAYYRSWVKTRYGSDRKRRMQGGGVMRTATDANSRLDLDQEDMAQWSNVQHVMTKWLINKLRRASVSSDSKRGTKVYITGVKTGSGAIDITSAINYLERVSKSAPTLKGYAKRDGSVVTAREHRMMMLEKLTSGDMNASLSKLRQSKYGQRLYRLAEQAAIREVREKAARKAAPKVEAPTKKRSSKSGSYKWGLQTGKLRDAWLNAHASKIKFTGKKFRVVIQPELSGDRLPGGGSLTTVLQNKIIRAGGNARFLKSAEQRKVVRRALLQVNAEQKYYFIRMRVKATKQ